MDHLMACDIGSGYVKVITADGKRFSSPSFVAQRPERLSQEFGGDSKEGLVTYKGETWITGQPASLSLSSLLEDTRTDQWAGSPGWMALLIKALADAGIRSGQVRLAVGVPQKSWSPILRDALVEKLVGRHTATVEGLPLDVEIIPADSMVIPQAFAGVAWVINNDPRAREVAMAGGLVAGIDPGTYTTGYVAFEGLNYSRALSGGVHDVGIWQTARQLQTMLDEREGYRTTVDKVMGMIRNPTKQFIGGSMMDITALLNEAVAKVTPSLIDRLKAVWTNPRAMDITVYGGGAELFLPDIQKSYPHARLVDMPGAAQISQFIPVSGMLSHFATQNNLLAD